MAEDMIEKRRLYVWVFVPSAVREGYQIGVSHAESGFEVTADVAGYDPEDACERVWNAVSVVEANPEFFSADAIDAPLSADLCERLNKRAQGEQSS